jgi:hypothetical protein
MASPEVLGRLILTPPIIRGAVTIKMINKTSITSMKGVTFMSDIELIPSLSSSVLVFCIK